MKRAFITELAESDLIKIWAYIARDKPEAADRFIDRLRSECEKLANLPDLGRLRPELANGRNSQFCGWPLFDLLLSDRLWD